MCFKYVFPARACKSNKVLVLARQLQEISRVYSNIQYTASNTHQMGTKNALANTQKWCWQVCYILHENAYDVLTSISVVRGLLSQLRSLASKVRSKIHKNPVNRYHRGLSPPRKTAARLTTSPPSDVFLGPSSTTRNATPPLQWCL